MHSNETVEDGESDSDIAVFVGYRNSFSVDRNFSISLMLFVLFGIIIERLNILLRCLLYESVGAFWKF